MLPYIYKKQTEIEIKIELPNKKSFIIKATINEMAFCL